MIVGELFIIVFYIFGIIYDIIIIKNFWKIVDDWDHDIIGLFLIVLFPITFGLMLGGLIIFSHDHIEWQIIKELIKEWWNTEI